MRNAMLGRECQAKGRLKRKFVYVIGQGRDAGYYRCIRNLYPASL